MISASASLRRFASTYTARSYRQICCVVRTVVVAVEPGHTPTAGLPFWSNVCVQVTPELELVWVRVALS